VSLSATPQLLLRKEVIQPHLPVRLPCYDLALLIDLTLGALPLAVRVTTSGALYSGGLTGGVYKTRERIQGSVADLPLLAIPTSWRRVAASNLN
jgi:hypothetical protein